ncbi:hypothetical protein [Streptomyces umbrinus]|uniref:hypothetical protein n=1 Tax=Streptomyces umbrinus TaxID=67370 RepID=UPI003C2EF2B7
MVRANASSSPDLTATSASAIPPAGAVRVKVCCQVPAAAMLPVAVVEASSAPSKPRAHSSRSIDRAAPPLATRAVSSICSPADSYRLKSRSVVSSRPSSRPRPMVAVADGRVSEKKKSARLVQPPAGSGTPGACTQVAFVQAWRERPRRNRPCRLLPQVEVCATPRVSSYGMPPPVSRTHSVIAMWKADADIPAVLKSVCSAIEPILAK